MIARVTGRRRRQVGGWRADEKAGFKYEGTLRQVILRFGKYNDVRIYSVLRSEFLESN